jgi:hypothetical protein
MNVRCGGQAGLDPEQLAVYFEDGNEAYEAEETDPRYDAHGLLHKEGDGAGLRHDDIIRLWRETGAFPSHPHWCCAYSRELNNPMYRAPTDPLVVPHPPVLPPQTPSAVRDV